MQCLFRTVFLENEKCNFAPFNRKSVFPEPDSSLGNQTMFYNDHRFVLSGHAPECHWLLLLEWRPDSFCKLISARAEYHRLSRLIESLSGSINKHCIAMHVFNWGLNSFCKSLTTRGRDSSTFTANWTLNCQFAGYCNKNVTSKVWKGHFAI